MSEEFKVEIVNPEKSFLLKENVIEVVVPAFEGEMGIMKDHISIITFLRPGIIKVEKKDNDFEEFFVQDGTIEFFNNTLILLSTSAINLKNLSKEFLEWKWISPSKLTDCVVHFKHNVYSKIKKELKSLNLI